jgi:outer membrane protein assembly factor BamB
VKFDNTGILLGVFGGGYDTHPESIVIDASGNFYVGQSDGSTDVLKFDAAGNLLDSYDVATGPRGTDWIDLAADQVTLRYTSEGSTIRTYNVSTDTQGPDFATGLPGYSVGHRILADGGDLLASWIDLNRLDSAGNIVWTYDALTEDSFFAMNLDPDGSSFWTGGYSSGDIYRFDIATGAILDSFNAGILGSSLAGLTVFGEITQGGGGTQVPEPSNLILLATGLIGLTGVFAIKRRLEKKRI